MLSVTGLILVDVRPTQTRVAQIQLGRGPDALNPEPEGMARCMRQALDDSRVTDAIGYINANGTATPANDRHETEAIKQVFGSRAHAIPVSSQKPMLGHCMGASGALQVATTALTLQTGHIPPTLNCEEPDPDCDLNYVPQKSVQAEGLEAALTNNFGSGGHLCSIVLSRSS